jgi:hypothetical protein
MEIVAVPTSHQTQAWKFSGSIVGSTTISGQRHIAIKTVAPWTYGQNPSEPLSQELTTIPTIGTEV